MKKLNLIALGVAACLAVPTVFADDKDKDSKQNGSCARISQVIGAKVESQNNESLGKIHELVVQNGQIQFAVLGVGGVLGIGEKLAPVPWKALNYSGEKEFTLNVDKQKLQSAPTIQKDQWSQLDSPSYTSQLYSFYGVQAPEATGGTGSQSSSESKSFEKSKDKDKDKDKE